MKKQNYFLIALMLLLLFPVTAQEKYFDWTNVKYDPDELLDLFKDGVPADLSELKDLEFRRSHTRFKDIVVDQAGQLDPSIDPRRSIFFNCPIGRSSAYSGMPSGVFDQDVFSMWPYIKVHGNWSNRWFTAPAAYVDAAHRHGVSVLSSWFFNWAHQYKPGQSKEVDPHSYMVEKMTKKDGQGNFVYAEAIINILMYFGMDGINYNYEANSNEATQDIMDLHARLYEIAKERGFDSFHIGWYDMVTNAGKLGRTSSLTTNNNKWYFNHTTKKVVSDMFMLDYNWGKTQLETSVNTAKLIQAPNGAFDVYAGCWMVGLKQAWNAINDVKDVSICLWGEHGMNRMFDHRIGLDITGAQENYQDKLEYVFVGGSQTPHPAKRLPITTLIDTLANDTKLKTFHGLSRFVTERSTLKGDLPFATNFILGNGKFYNEKGVKTHGNWYNLSAQNIVPTYRWLIMDGSGNPVENIKADFTFNDAWYGGTALQIKGEVKSAPTDIHLYRSDLKAGANAKATLVYKIENGQVGESSNLYLILKKNNDTDWTEFDLGAIAQEGWNEVDFRLAGFNPTDQIKAIGLRVKASAAKTDYNALIGELKLYNSTRTSVAAPQDVTVEYLNETDRRMDIKLVWTMSQEDKNRLVYNDEVNVHHFEIFVREDENDAPKEVAKTSAWAHYLESVMLSFTPVKENLFVGVRAVSTDLVTKSDIVWKTINRDPNATVEPEPDIYCVAKNNMTYDNSAEVTAKRYFAWAKTEGALTNIDVTGSAPTDGYAAFLDESNVITVDPGSTFKFKAQGADNDNTLKWCRYFMYADWNKNREFDVDTEILARGGKPNAGDDAVMSLDVTINVPADAKSGYTRLRVRYCDAWRTHPGPCGDADYGYSADFLVFITGDNTNISEQTTAAPVFYPNPVVDNVTFKNVDTVTLYTLNGGYIGTYTEETVNLSHLQRGAYIVKMEKDGVTKAAQLLKK